MSAGTAAADMASDAAPVASSGATLWAMCAVLFVGAFLTGLPAVMVMVRGGGRKPATGWLAAVMEGRSLRSLSAGLMLGSGLGVVVPEGFFAFTEGAVDQGSSALPEWCAGAALVSGFIGMLALQQSQHAHHHLAAAAGGHSQRQRQQQQQGHRQGHDRPRSSDDVPVDSAAAAGSRSLSRVATAATVARGSWTESRQHKQHRAEAPKASWNEAGDGGPGSGGGAGGGGRGPFGRAPSPYSALPSAEAVELAAHAGRAPLVAAVASTATPYGSDVESTAAAAAPGPPASASASAGVALAGLLVHSAADGIAVGAASLGGTPSLTLTVAAAIMAHKLPVTFGLTAFLRDAGWTRAAVVKGLLAFSASAPAAALATFYLLSALLGTAGGGSGSGEGGRQQGVALVLLLSGGTFLAAATQHILPAALEDPRHCDEPRAGSTGGGGVATGAGGAGAGTSSMPGHQGSSDKGRELGRRMEERAPGCCGVDPGFVSQALLVAGALLPLVIAALVPEAD